MGSVKKNYVACTDSISIQYLQMYVFYKHPAYILRIFLLLMNVIKLYIFLNLLYTTLIFTYLVHKSF